MKSIPDATLILEDGDDCEVCGGTDNLGLWNETITVCQSCHDDGKFQEWFVREMEAALTESPDYEQLPNGNWKYIGLSKS
jgi:hypothetical protein